MYCSEQTEILSYIIRTSHTDNSKRGPVRDRKIPLAGTERSGVAHGPLADPVPEDDYIHLIAAADIVL